MINKMLVIAPHPDDETIGCGGVIARYASEKQEVHVAIITKGQMPLYSQKSVELCRKEAKKAHILLGVAETHYLDFPAAQLDRVLHGEINKSLDDLIRKIKPDKIFIPFIGDVHMDHQLVFLSAIVASRPITNFKPINIYAYETLSETNWNAPYLTPTFVPNVFVDISQYLEKKIAAFNCYKSQIRCFPNERSAENLRCLAKLRGSQVNCLAAEAFVLIRSVF